MTSLQDGANQQNYNTLDVQQQKSETSSDDQKVRKEDFYVKYQDEISNYMVALGLFSQVPFYII